jgi:hypothetical protein
LVKLFKEQTMPQFSDDLFLGPAQTYMGTGIRPYSTTFTGSIATTTLTVTALLQGAPLVVGMYVDGSSVTDGTYITAFGTGTGGIGTYTVSASSTASSTTMTAHGNINFDNPSPMDLGVGPLGRVYIFDVVPQTLVANNIAATQTPAAAGALTLTAGTSVKSVVLNNGATALQLDVPRAVSVTTGAGSPTTRNLTVSGFDYYGQAMSEVIASSGSASTAVNGKKAFYIITGITVSGGTVVAITVGTTDIIGLPVRVFDAGYVINVKYDNTLAADAGTFVAAATATATTTTGDVRGTYVPSSATNGLKRLVMAIALPAIAVGPNATRVGALGVTQA